MNLPIENRLFGVMEIYKLKLKEDIRCPPECGLDVFGGEWKPRIICALAEKGRLRYSELRREMTDITDVVLAAALKELMNDDIIYHRQYGEIPPRVEYCLTEKGNSAVPILQNICRWSEAHHKKDRGNAPSQRRKCDYHAGF